MSLLVAHVWGQCPHTCATNRLTNFGFCGVDAKFYVHSLFISIFEPDFLNPAGAVYLGGCNMRCSFCQNYELIEKPRDGKTFSPEELTKYILYLQDRSKCIEWIGGEPLLYSLQILELLRVCKQRLNVPQVISTNLYFNPLLLEVLSGVFDLWLCDFKFWNEDCAIKIASVNPDYRFLIEMNLRLLQELNEDFLVVHLPLPSHYDCCTEPIINFCRENEYPLLLLTQYRPEYKARNNSKLGRSLGAEELSRIISKTRELSYYVIY